MILMSQMSLLDERHSAAFDEWYLEHLRTMSSVSGIFSAQRFKTSTPGFPRSLAMYSVESQKAFANPRYRSIRGLGAMTPLVDHLEHHVDLFAGLDSAPALCDGECVLLANAQVPGSDIAGVAFSWLECVGRDYSTRYRGIAVVGAKAIPALDSKVAVYHPASERFGFRSQLAGPTTIKGISG